MDLSTRNNLVSRLKEVYRMKTPDGYYAGRILCDILPTVSLLDGLDAIAVAEQLKEIKGQRGNEGRHHNRSADFRRIPTSCVGDGVC